METFELATPQLLCRETKFLAFDGECVDHRAQTCLELGRWSRVASHCDSRVLHKLGACEFCDRYPDRQCARVQSAVMFTDDDPKKKVGWLLCPSVQARGASSVNSWPGNRPNGLGGTLLR